MGLALLLLLACDNDSTPSPAATRIPAFTATPTLTAPPPPGTSTATPTPEPSLADHCNIAPSMAVSPPSTPSPTPRVLPTRTPPPDWDPAAFEVLWDALTGASAAGGGFAFEAEMTVSGRVDGAPVRYEAILDGVSQDGQPYTRLNVAANSHGRVRIETVSRRSDSRTARRCTRPHGRVRIETDVVMSIRPVCPVVAPGLMVG